MIYLRYVVKLKPEHPKYVEGKTLLAHVYVDSQSTGEATWKASSALAFHDMAIESLEYEEVLEEPKGASPSDMLLLSYFDSARRHQVHCHFAEIEDVS